MYDPNHNASPFNAVPIVALLIAAPIALIELALQLGARGLIGGPEAVGWRVELIQKFGFYDTIFEQMLTSGHVQPDWLWRFATYPFISASLPEALIGSVIVLGTGSFFARHYPLHRVVLAFLIPAAAGALATGLLMDAPRPLIGPIPAGFGMLGTFSFVQWIKERNEGGSGWGAFGMVGTLMVLQGVRGFFFGDWMGSLATTAGVLAGVAASFYVTISGRQMARQFFLRLRRG